MLVWPPRPRWFDATVEPTAAGKEELEKGTSLTYMKWLPLSWRQKKKKRRGAAEQAAVESHNPLAYRPLEH